MKVRRFLAASVATIAAVAAVAVAFTVLPGRGPGDRSEHWDRQLRHCSDLLRTATPQTPETTRGCLDAVLGEVIRARSLLPMSEVLAQLDRDVDGFRSVCHASTHSLGDLIRESYADDAELLVAHTAARVCGDGLAHAVMESYGRTLAVGDPQWIVLAAACDSHGARVEQGADGCSHGLGHAAFLATEDVAAALSLCEATIVAIPAEQRGNSPMEAGCSYGVMMSAHGGGGLQVVDIADPELVPLDCLPLRRLSESPGRYDSAEAFLGCMKGAGFSLGGAVGARTDRLEATRVMISACRDALPEELHLSVPCTEQVLMWAAPLLWQGADRYHAICASFEQNFDHLTRIGCLAAAANTLSDRQNDEILAFDPALRDEIMAVRARL